MQNIAAIVSTMCWIYAKHHGSSKMFRKWSRFDMNIKCICTIPSG